MGSPWHNLLSKNDRALAAYLVSVQAGTAADVLPAKLSSTKTLPITICFSENAAEVAAYTATYKGKATIMVRSKAPLDAGQTGQAARLASESRVAKTFDAFHSDVTLGGAQLQDGGQLAADITNAARALAISDPTNNGDLADYTMLDLQVTGVEASFIEDGAVWEDSLTLEWVAAPANVS